MLVWTNGQHWGARASAERTVYGWSGNQQADRWTSSLQKYITFVLHTSDGAANRSATLAEQLDSVSNELAAGARKREAVVKKVRMSALTGSLPRPSEAHCVCSTARSAQRCWPSAIASTASGPRPRPSTTSHAPSSSLHAPRRSLPRAMASMWTARRRHGRRRRTPWRAPR